MLDWGHCCCVAVGGAVSARVSSGITGRTESRLPGAIGESVAMHTRKSAVAAHARIVKTVLRHVSDALQLVSKAWYSVAKHVSSAQEHVSKA